MDGLPIFPVGRLNCTGCCFATRRGCVGLRYDSPLFAKFAILVKKDVDLIGLEVHFHNGTLILSKDFLPDRDDEAVAILLVVPKTSSGKLVFDRSRPWSLFDGWVSVHGAMEVTVRGA